LRLTSRHRQPCASYNEWS